MPITSLLSLLDDLASVLDDVAVLTKVAARKTAGVLGDDLALNAEQVAGVRAERELPVVWAVAKGSLVNKAILVPAALLISAVTPWAVVPLLAAGGVFLCFEGFEKLAHSVGKHHANKADHAAMLTALADPGVDLVAFEKKKIKGAIRTDLVLSAEIVTITLGTVAASAFLTRVAVLSAVAVVMTIGVYGVVAGIVKLDDIGLWLVKGGNAAGRSVGALILRSSPWMMKGLSIAGTVAMFLVGGGIVVHAIPGAEERIGNVFQGGIGDALLPTLADGAVGILAGALALGVVTVGKKLFGKKAAPAH